MKQEYLRVAQECDAKVRALEQRGVSSSGLNRFYEELFEAVLPAFEYEMGAIYVVLPVFTKLDHARRSVGFAGMGLPHAMCLSPRQDGLRWNICG